MTFSFRNRIFVGLIALGAVPLAVAVVALTLQTRTSTSLTGPRIALDQIAESSRSLTSVLDTLELTDTAQAALRRHTDIIARGTRLTRQAETLSRASAAALATVILVSGIGLVAGSVYVAQRWSRTVSQPVENLIGLIGRIERREPLPHPPSKPGSPEIEALTHALYNMAGELEQARIQELEQERLIAFREVARRVAHEIRGPVTASRLAVAQLNRTPTPDDVDALSVLEEETDRLERMAIEFSLFGRLPEGPRAEIDVAEMLDSVVAASVPPDVSVRRAYAAGLTISGNYEPMRRAVQNLVANAVEATDQRGIEIHAVVNRDGSGIEIRVTDHGPGIPAEQRSRVFEPYMTTKAQGTGLGLAIVRQIVEAHGGKVSIESPTGGGTSFVIGLPVESA
jgi:signal transduction histidine kinase